MNPALILIVEDDATVAANLEDTLVQIGYRVAGLVSTGDAAVKAALELHPDAILMDIHLRGEKDGIQAAAEIQQQSDIPVVYLTAYSDETLIGQAKKANGFSYLTHPVDERELRANLEMTLYKSQLEKHILHLNQVLHAIRDVHKLIIREHQPQRLLEESCNILVQTRGYHFVLIGQLQEGRAVALASAGEGNALMELITRSATRQQAEMLPATEAMRTKQVVICADMANDERYAPWRETIKNEHFACAAAIPMLYEGEERGVLCIFSQVSTIFDNEETDMVLEISGDIAFALKTIEDEISLQKSQALYRQLVENTNDLVCEVDQEGRFTYLNPQYEQVLGYTPQELLGTKVSELGHREEENTRKDKYAALLETQSPSRETWRFRHKNGEWHWLECSGMVFEKSPGEKAVSVVSRDITERKHMEESLRLSEEKFSKTFHTSPDAININRLEDGLYIEINEGFTALTGYSREEVMGKTSREIDIWGAPSDRDRLVKGLRERGEVNNLEASFRIKNGGFKICLMSARIIEIGGETCILSITRDISERKQMEISLRESQERFQRVAETAGEWIWEVDREGLYTYVSPVVEKVLGYAPMELVGKKHFYDLFSPSVRAKLTATALASFARGAPIRHLINDNVCKDGHIIILETSATPRFDEDGHLIGYIGADTDITARRLAEETVQNSEARLKAIFDASGIILSMTDPEGHFLQVNQAFIDRFGFSLAEIDHMSYLDILHPDEVGLTLKNMSAMQKGTRSSSRRELRFINRDGKTLWVDLSITAVYGQNGEITTMAAAGFDISERKQTEAALRESQLKLSAIFENSRDAIGVSYQGVHILTNPAYAAMFGYEREEELQGTPVLDLIAPEARPAVAEYISLRAAGKAAPTFYETKGQRRNGEIFDMGTTVSTYELDQKLYTLVLIRDVTERKQAEDHLRMSEAALKKSQAVAHVGHWRWNTQTNQLNWSDEMYRIFGYQPGCAPADLSKVIAQAIHPDDREKVDQANEAVISAQKPAAMEYRVVWPDGSVHTVWAQPDEKIRDETGAITELSGIVQDITTRRQAEEALRASEAHFHSILNNSNAGYFFIDTEGFIRDINPAWARLYGYDSANEILGHHFVEIQKLDDMEAAKKFVDGILNGDPRYLSGEFSRKCKDGSIGYHTFSARPVTHEGKVIGFEGFIIDSSEQKKMEEELQDSEQKYRTLFGAMTEGMALHRVVYDDEHRAVDYIIEEINPAFEKQVGIQGDAARGALASVLYGVNPAPYLQIYARVAESGEPFLFQDYFAPLQRYFDISVVSPRSGWFATIFTDVTERKKIEDSLQRYHLLAENSSDIILFIRQQDGRIVEANQAANEAYGYLSAELLALNISDLTAPGELTGLVATIEMGYSKGMHFETRHRRKNGAIFPVEVSSRGASVDGQAVLLSIIRDSSERKQNEEALLASKQRYESLFQDSPIPLLEIDLSRAKYAVEQMAISGVANPTAYYLAHPQMDSLMGKNLIILDINQTGLAFFNASDKTDFLSRLQDYTPIFWDANILADIIALLMGEITSFEKELQINLPNDEERWIKINMVVDPEYVQSLERVLVAMSDLTARKHAENVLRQAEERFRALFETMSQGVFYNDPEGHIIQANPAAQHILGIPLEAILGRTPEDSNWQRIHEDGSPFQPGESIARPTIQSGKPLNHQVFGIYNPTVKDYRWVDVNTVPLLRVDETLPHPSYIVFEDVTERRQMEMEKEALLAKTRRQAERLEVIIRISASLRQAQEEKEVLKILVEQSSQGLKAGTVLLGLIENQELYFGLAEGEWETFCGHREDLDEPLMRLLFSGKPIIYHSLREIQRARLPVGLQPILKGMQACLVIPFKVVDAPIGLLLAGYKHPLAESEDRLNLAVAIGEIAGITLQRMRLLLSLERLAGERAKDLTGLYNVISAASGSWDIESVLKQVLEQALHIINAKDGAILAVDSSKQQFNLLSVFGLEDSRVVIASLPLNDSVEGWVVEHSEPLLISNINFDERFHISERMQQEQYAYLGLPMRTRGQVMGVLLILRSGEPFNLEEITLIGSIADHIALIIDNLSLYHLYEQTAVTEERSRLARDLHDSATQSLYSVTLYAEASRTMVEKNNLAQAQQYLDRLSQTAHLALQEMRLLVYELRPPSLEQDGLVIALRKRLESVESRADIQTHIDMTGLISLTARQEEHLFWIAMETLNNSLKHASATQIEVSLKIIEDQIVFMIKDNGKGYDLEKARQSGGMGLQNMQQRAQKIGARLEIITKPGEGAAVWVHLPLMNTEQGH